MTPPMYSRSGRREPAFPCSTSCSSAVTVKVFVTLPMRMNRSGASAGPWPCANAEGPDVRLPAPLPHADDRARRGSGGQRPADRPVQRHVAPGRERLADRVALDPPQPAEGAARAPVDLWVICPLTDTVPSGGRPRGRHELGVAGGVAGVPVDGSAAGAVAEDPQPGAVLAGAGRLRASGPEAQLPALHGAAEQARARVAADEPVEVGGRGDEAARRPGVGGADQRRDVLVAARADRVGSRGGTGAGIAGRAAGWCPAARAAGRPVRASSCS